MERIRKVLKRLAAWRPFSFLDRFVRPPPPLEPYGWVETPVDRFNQAGKAMGLLLTKEMEKGERATEIFHKLIGKEGSDSPIWKGGPGIWK